MRAMIGAALRFARDDAGAHVDQRIDLGSLLESIADDMQGSGGAVTANPGPRVIVRGDPTGLRRLFANLIENAVRYGDRATLHWQVGGGHVDVLIDDHGPGFDPALAERLFEPFVRGDPSRSRETGGTGLGLAIVRSLAEVHRGTVSLERGPDGGRVRVRLPLDGS
jgi:signal transduction histidine kinase